MRNAGAVRFPILSSHILHWSNPLSATKKPEEPKNWLFVGHPEAGERSAVIYTLLGSCRRHGVNPFDYLKDLFTRLPAAKIKHINEFTPSAWAKAKAKEQSAARGA